MQLMIGITCDAPLELLPNFRELRAASASKRTKNFLKKYQLSHMLDNCDRQALRTHSHLSYP